jgi:hypothetical protein
MSNPRRAGLEVVYLLLAVLGCAACGDSTSSLPCSASEARFPFFYGRASGGSRRISRRQFVRAANLWRSAGEHHVPAHCLL